MDDSREIYQALCLQLLSYPATIVRIDELDNEPGHEIVVLSERGVKEIIVIKVKNIYEVVYRGDIYTFNRSYLERLANRHIG